MIIGLLILLVVLLHLWTGAMSGEGSTRVHRAARVSAIAGLVSLLAFTLCLAWEALTMFPPLVLGGAVRLALVAVSAALTTATSIGLCIALHVRRTSDRA